VLEQTYGEYMFYEDAFNDCCPRLYQEMLDKETSIFPVDYPDIEVKSFTKDGVVFTATITLLPEVTLGDYKGIKVEKKAIKVTEAEVKRELEALREKNARFVDVADRAAKLGDIVNLDYAGSIDGVAFAGGTAKDQELELGSHTFIEGFEDQMVGMNIGEEKDINVTFPTEYHAKELAGKPAVFHVKVLSIREKQLPSLNDAFAADVSEFSTMEELKNDTKSKLQHEKEHAEEHRIEDELISKVVDNATVEVPEAMVKSQLDAYLDDMRDRLAYQGLKLEDYFGYIGTTEEEYRKTNHDEAKKSVKTSLVLEEIIKKEGIVASPEEMDKKLEEVAGRMNKKVDELKKTMTKNQESMIRNNIVSEKVIALLKSLNNIG
jgi:trigger factor